MQSMITSPAQHDRSALASQVLASGLERCTASRGTGARCRQDRAARWLPAAAGALLVFLSLGLLPPASGQTAQPRPLTPFVALVGNGCQTQVVCAAIERLGLYAGLRLHGTATDTETGRELAFGGTFSLGLDLIRRVALEASFPVGLIYRGTESTLFPIGPFQVGGRLRLGGAAPTLFSSRPQPRLAWVLAAYVTLPLPHAAGDERHATVLGAPQPDVQVGAEIRWGPVQLVPSLGALVAEKAVYLRAGGRVTLSLSQSLRFDLEAQSRLPLFLPDDGQGRCGRGGRVGLGLRGLLSRAVMGTIAYDHGLGDCEASHQVTLGATIALGDEPLKPIPTPTEAGKRRFWMGMVDPVLDCNGWMLDDETMLPKFKYGDPDPSDPNLIRRGSEVFHVGDHFDIDRDGYLYRPTGYVALADGHRFSEAPVADKLALPVCEFGPKHRFFEHCQFLAKSVEKFAEVVQADAAAFGPHAAPLGPIIREMQYEEECLAREEKEDPRAMAMGLLSALSARGKASMHSQPPSPPKRRSPGDLEKQPPPSNLSTSPPAAGSTGHAGGGAAAFRVTLRSTIHESPYAVRMAEALCNQAQSDVDKLLLQLANGNKNPGIGTRRLGGGFYELRGSNAGRVIIKQTAEDAYDIVGKFQGHVRGDTANSDIINRLIEDYLKARK